MTDGPGPAADSGPAGEPKSLVRGKSAATVAQWVEVHRLAVVGRDQVIAQDVGDRVARVWLPRSRFADVATLANATLTLGPHAGAFYHLGQAQASTWQPQQALDNYQQALPLMRDVGNRAGEATTLNNIGAIRLQQDDFAGAKKSLDEVLEICHVIGDRGSEAMARFNMAVLLLRMARVDDAAECQRRAIDLAEQTSHPALDRMRAFLVQLQQTRKG